MPTKDDFPKDLAADAVLPFTLSGISLEIPRSILTPELWLAFEAGYYEGSEISALRSAVRPGDAVLEVGAGVGFISAFVQRALGAATVWVIEANEALIPTIHRTHELNGVSATVLAGVAGDRDGPVRFHYQTAFWGSSVLPLPDSQAVNVPGINLGRIIREMRPDVLVVDIEGGERDLFSGLDLSGVRSIVVEVHHPQIGPTGIAKCFAALQDAGYAYYPDGSAGTNVMFTRFRSSPFNGVTSAVSGEGLLGDYPDIISAVFDCVIYDGEIDALAIRLHELDAVVDWFIIVESTLTSAGQPRDISFDPADPRISHFGSRFRHVVVSDMPETDDPRQREIWQRNAVLRGVPDAGPDDLLILSDVDEIPRAAVVSEMRNDRETAVFALELGVYCFFVDYRNVQSPDAATNWTIAARRSALNGVSPNDMCRAVRNLHMPARIIGNAGWHFSFLMDDARVRRKIAAFSHPEFNDPAFLEQIDIGLLVQRKGDFFQRPGFVWALVDPAELPAWLQANKDTLGHLFAPGALTPSGSILQPLAPIVICPGVLDREKDEIQEKLSALASEEGFEEDLVTARNVDRITSLDTEIFSIQAGHNLDRVSFLRIQNLVRETGPVYSYLEVGSDIGGSLLPHLLDPRCAAAVSIDSRPEEQPDERGIDFQYSGNSTERMLLELGRHVRLPELSKLSTIDNDISAVDRSSLTIRPQLVLIDAEHTNVAAFSDFMAVLPLIADDAMVTFHDANLVGDAIQMIERFLQHAKIHYGLMILPSCVAVFGFGTFVRSMEIVLRPYAELTAAYFADARHQRHQSVADAVIGQTEGLPGHSIREVVTTIRTMNDEIVRLGLALDEAHAVHAQDQVVIDTLIASTSWRVTAPLRAAANLVRRRGT